MHEGYSVEAVEAALDEILPIETTPSDVTETLERDDVYVTGDATSLINVINSQADDHRDDGSLTTELLKQSLIKRLPGVDAVVKGSTITLVSRTPGKDPAHD